MCDDRVCVWMEGGEGAGKGAQGRDGYAGVAVCCSNVTLVRHAGCQDSSSSSRGSNEVCNNLQLLTVARVHAAMAEGLAGEGECCVCSRHRECIQLLHPKMCVWGGGVEGMEGMWCFFFIGCVCVWGGG